MTKQQQIDLLQQKLDTANKHIATVDNELKRQYLSISLNTICEIRDWFEEEGQLSTIADIFEYFDNLRESVISRAAKYKPSIMCELVLSLGEARRQLAEQRIKGGTR